MYRIHLIAIGGSIMHNLALALAQKGFQISGSDDQIFEPARSRLAQAGLLPEREGWNPDKIDHSIDLIILGMHAKKDNPELLKAIESGIPVQSFPEYIGKMYKDKKQIVVTGSHGKTTTTAMLIHVFQKCKMDCDYLVGAQLEGFQNMVSITVAPYAIIEGDEYLSSCLDDQPKFNHYEPEINIITGIAWDHYNVFPTFDSYTQAFENRVATMKPNSHVVYYDGDQDLRKIISTNGHHLTKHPYHEASYQIENDQVYLILNNNKYPMQIFGRHNMQNVQAVIEVAAILGLDLDQVAHALTSFKGAAKRMELISSNNNQIRYRDFAHAPSKVNATLHAVRERYPDKKILVVLELHTYSSLNKEFLPQYKNSTDGIDKTIIYYDEKAMEIKRMPSLDPEFVKSAFNNSDLLVCGNVKELERIIHEIQGDYQLLLFLGSGQFGGMDLTKQN